MLTGSVASVIGKTPMIKIKSLSDATGCEIYAKAEFLNPGGSVKDRAALGIIQDAEQKGLLRPGSVIFEGTAGNTGIGLATVAAERGYRCVLVMPNNQSLEKYQTLAALGAQVQTVEPCPFTNPKHFYHTAKRLSEEMPGSFWANQFENLANGNSHLTTTGPEIWEQMNGQLHGFICAVGSGGTISGVSRYLKQKSSKIETRIVDPMGSGIYSYLKTGQLTATGSSITEGIGIMRLTENFKAAIIDSGLQLDDQAMISMLYHLAKHDGLIVGTSGALNLAGAYRWALEHKGSGKRFVTMMCDSGLRYQSKIFNPVFLAEKGLKPEPLF